MNKSILIIVPAYNEAQNIEAVIDDLNSLGIDLTILVIDDGSSDNTSEVAKSCQSCVVIRHFINLGIGGAVQSGFKFAKRNNFDIAIQFDGDGQHDSEYIKHLIDEAEQGYDMVIGSRFLFLGDNFKSTLPRRLGIKFLQLVSYILIGTKITDSTSGFRAYSKNAIEFLAENYPEDYPEPEAIILLSKNSYKIKEIPVKMNSRQKGESSIKGFSYLYYFFKVSLAMLLTNFRPKMR